jgi:hypothetical protein
MVRCTNMHLSFQSGLASNYLRDRRVRDQVINFWLNFLFRMGYKAFLPIVDLLPYRALAPVRWLFQPKAKRQISDPQFCAESKYSGARRCFVACSNANAIAINFGSLHAVPTNEMPTGKPLT